jgi:hypothetical protein
MSTFLQVLFSIIGVVFFLFFYWLRLREDYTKDQIFSSGFYIVIGVIVGFLLSTFLKLPLIRFWVIFTGFSLGLVLGTYRFKLKFYEGLEAAILGMFFWSLFTGNWHMIIFIPVFYFLSGSYKRFTWYKSGKVGFAGLGSLALYFLFRGVVAFFLNPGVLSFDIVSSAVVAFILFLSIFNLGRVK